MAHNLPFFPSITHLISCFSWQWYLQQLWFWTLKEREYRCRKYLISSKILNIFLQKYLNVFLQNYFRSLFAMKEFISQMNYFLCSGLRGRCAEKATWKYKETYITIYESQKVWKLFLWNSMFYHLIFMMLRSQSSGGGNQFIMANKLPL